MRGQLSFRPGVCVIPTGRKRVEESAISAADPSAPLGMTGSLVMTRGGTAGAESEVYDVAAESEEIDDKESAVEMFAEPCKQFERLTGLDGTYDARHGPDNTGHRHRPRTKTLPVGIQI